MEYVNMENRQLRVEEQVYNFAIYLFDNGVVTNEESLSTIRSKLNDSVKQVFGKKAIKPIDLVTTINKVLARKGVIQWG
jgi:hypothetical protein